MNGGPAGATSRRRAVTSRPAAPPDPGRSRAVGPPASAGALHRGLDEPDLVPVAQLTWRATGELTCLMRGETLHRTRAPSITTTSTPNHPARTSRALPGNPPFGDVLAPRGRNARCTPIHEVVASAVVRRCDRCDVRGGSARERRRERLSLVRRRLRRRRPEPPGDAGRDPPERARSDGVVAEPPRVPVGEHRGQRSSRRNRRPRPRRTHGTSRNSSARRRTPRSPTSSDPRRCVWRSVRVTCSTSLGSSSDEASFDLFEDLLLVIVEGHGTSGRGERPVPVRL